MGDAVLEAQTLLVNVERLTRFPVLEPQKVYPREKYLANLRCRFGKRYLIFAKEFERTEPLEKRAAPGLGRCEDIQTTSGFLRICIAGYQNANFEAKYFQNLALTGPCFWLDSLEGDLLMCRCSAIL